MKRLLNPTGGRPVKNEDLQLFEQFITLFEGLFSEFEDGIIVSGCEITGTSGDYDISSGYIYYDGNICVFDGVEGVSSLPYAMEKTETEGTPRTFFDDVSKNTINTIAISGQVGGGFSLTTTSPRLSDYMPSVATETTGRSGTNNTDFMSSLRVLDFIRNGTGVIATTTNKGTVEKATAVEFAAATADVYPDAQMIWEALGYTAWQTPTLNSGFTHGTPNLQYRFNGNSLQFRGVVIATSASGTLFTLPSAYRPAYQGLGYFGAYGAANIDTYGFQIQTGGNVRVFDMVTGGYENVFNCSIILD